MAYTWRGVPHASPPVCPPTSSVAPGSPTICLPSLSTSSERNPRSVFPDRAARTNRSRARVPSNVQEPQPFAQILSHHALARIACSDRGVERVLVCRLQTDRASSESTGRREGHQSQSRDGHSPRGHQGRGVLEAIELEQYCPGHSKPLAPWYTVTATALPRARHGLRVPLPPRQGQAGA